MQRRLLARARRWRRPPASCSSARSCSLPFALVTSLASGFDPTPRRVGALVILGVVNTGIAYWLNYGAIAQVGATAASLVTYLVPPVAIVAGWLVLDEPVSWRLVVGLAPDRRRRRRGAARARRHIGRTDALRRSHASGALDGCAAADWCAHVAGCATQQG